MPSGQRVRLRATFEEVPEAYDRARPTYPAAVFDDLGTLAQLQDGARLVEIGCGTGQATVALAERGFGITCVELGEQLAALARAKLAAFPAVEVVNAAFETWEPSESEFDAVLAFTAFHWIDPNLRYPKASWLLRDGGALAVVATQHVLPENGDRFFDEVQADYEAIVPEDEKTKAGGPLPPEAIDDLAREIEESGLFQNVGAQRYLWDVVYTADDYIAVLDTYSGHRVLDVQTRERLYDLIRRRIHARPESRVRKTYLATLNVARRL